MTRFVQLTTVQGRVCFVNPDAVALIEVATIAGQVMPAQTRLHLLPLLHPVVVHGSPEAVALVLADPAAPGTPRSSP